MRDFDVRIALNREMVNLFPPDPDTLVINELGVCQGEARVDIAVINGKIHGFEIKSDSDTLERLPSQLEVYNRVLETMTIVTGENHLEKIKNLVPEWWGIIKVCQLNKEVCFERLRRSLGNPSIDALSLVQLLWHNETVSILERYGLSKSLKNKPRRFLWSALVERFPLTELSDIVRATLKNRDSLKKRNSWQVG